MIQTTCPHCGAMLRIADAYAGKTGRCKHCKRKLTVPEPTVGRIRDRLRPISSGMQKVIITCAAIIIIIMGALGAKLFYDYYRPTIYTNIHESARQGNVSDIKRHLRRGAAINEKDHTGVTPLHIAANEGHMRTCRYLVTQGAQINAVATGKITPLFLAVSAGYEDVSRYLIEKGADVNAKEEDGHTPLHLAIMTKNLDIIKYLVENGAAINNKNRDGDTPLLLAATMGDAHSVEYLVAQGAEMSVMNKYGANAMAVAAITANDAVFRILKDTMTWENDGNMAMNFAIKTRHERAVQFLLDNKVDINGRDKEGWTHLHEAAVSGNTAIIYQLLMHGANVNAKTNYNDTPLHHAAYRGNTPVASTLINAGADVNLCDANGYTPMMFAVGQEHTAMIALLRPYDRQSQLQFQATQNMLRNEQTRDQYQQRQQQRLSTGEKDLLRLQAYQNRLQQHENLRQVFNVQQAIKQEEIRRRLR